ncbi:ROK family transcriptional regulator [Paracoccus sediminis]|uniref:ROK family transcriptional regulator n=1 Tax=Paracoccus sediminis TaxID=1214787 RepID=A0A238XAH4_9RHOB|nr:ROK family transcriptional regulator [Paracoccus sediminis]TBN49590.1 ROK family transcriptional regulator [Paracoccus sediminis]SNR55937.1 Sugar kinase of the NBD/HSP70 family, may contain an N-terminal HTH domain [Paracoccus sediminis]
MLNDPIPWLDLSQNERQILSLIRRRGPLPRAALAHVTGLSPQAITNLTRKLIQNGFLDAGEVVRGKVGQPSTPLSLAPEGALFLGLKLGRRLVELALVDFVGHIKIHRQEIYSHPTPERVLAFARQGLATILDSLAPSARIAGMGIAAPFRLWDWGSEMAGWHDVDLSASLAEGLAFPVFLENDASTACAAELIFGRSVLPRDFVHLYIAHFAGGGVVLDGRLRIGPRRNAGALGSMPIPGGRQLLDAASVSTLEQRLGRSLPPDDSGWQVPTDVEAQWIAEAAHALAFVALSATALLDIPVVVIDGAVPPATRRALADATRTAMEALPAAGIDRPKVIEGSLARSARILGAAALPLAHFFEPGGALA